MRKRITAVVLCLLLLMQTAFAAEPEGLLKAIGILPGAYQESETATRGLFAYCAARLAGLSDVGWESAPFTDISESEYRTSVSALYQNGFVAGISETRFAPEQPLTQTMADVVLVKILGYEKLAQARGTDGFLAVAGDLGLNRGITTDKNGNLTVDAMFRMFSNALCVETTEFSYEDGKGSISESGENVLGAKFGISAYQGRFYTISEESGSAEFYVEKNKYKKNHRILSEKNVYTFSVENAVTLYDAEYTSATVWVDDEENILYYEPDEKTEVRYLYLDSVNGDDSEDHSYAMPYVSQLTFYDDDKVYRTKDTILRYNGEVTEEPQQLAGRFAKAVIGEGRTVLFLDCYDLKTGGLITAVKEDEIIYTRGESENLRLKEFENKTLTAFLDGRRADFSEIKIDSVFDYYETEDRLVLNASERVISDVLRSVGGESISIGNISFDRRDTYFKSGSGAYQKNTGYNSLIGRDVIAYFDPMGYCAYVIAADGALAVKEFLGLMLSYDDEDEDDIVITVYALEPEISKRVLHLRKKVKFNDNLTREDLQYTTKDKDGEGLFLFRLDNDGKVKEVSEPEPFYGLGASETYVSQFPNDRIPYINVNGYTLFFEDAPIIGIYNNDGVFAVKNVSWNDLLNKTADGVKVHFYGEGESSDVRLVLLSGKTESIMQKEMMCGVITSKKVTVDEDDQICYDLTIESYSTMTCRVDEETGKNLPEKAFILFYQQRSFEKTGIKITEAVDLTGDPEDWGTGSFLAKQLVRKSDAKRLFFYNDTALFANPGYNFVLKKEGKHFERIGLNEIEPGSRAIYYLAGDLRGVIVY